MVGVHVERVWSPRGGGYPGTPCKWYPSMPCRSPGGSPGPQQVERLRSLAGGGGVSRPIPGRGGVYLSMH